MFTGSPSAPGAPVHLTIGFAHVNLSQLKLSVDCVDLIGPTGARLPGGRFSGQALIAGEEVRIQDLTADESHGTISFTLTGLPGGGHKVQVSAPPDYLDSLPPGYVHWNRPLGALDNSQIVSVFRVQITSPVAGTRLPLGSVAVTGVATHGMPITSIRVHGQQVSPLGDTFISGDSCSGPRHTVHFSALVPVSQISQDIVSGNDRTSSVDPGVNFVSVIATDSLSDAAGDRTRFVVGPTSVSASSPAMRRLAVTGGASCDPRLLTPGFVADGFAASLSERAIDQLIRARGLAPACSLVVCTLLVPEGTYLSRGH